MHHQLELLASPQAVRAIAGRYLETVAGFAAASRPARTRRVAAATAATVDPPVRLLLADVDGTLVTNDKVLTERAVEAVGRLGAAGVRFAITSGRPPRGMAMLLQPLDLRTPVAAFNGGVFVRHDMSIMSQRAIPAEVVAPVIELLQSSALDVWLYRGADWFVRDLAGPHVERERRTVRFDPTLVQSFAGCTDAIAKVVGVSDDHDAVTAATRAVRERFGGHVSAAPSQPYYLDVTHPQANKGSVVKFLSATYQLPTEQIATIGDMPNDVLMFAHSGVSIAMGNASPEVQRAARHVTATNEDEGFAAAVERFILPD